ncbi:relaxin receptor 2 [Limosa lapponica baueri]|uniref:Relaxin receptor 2 n=1 Tax=Limosa lapponica baueri TaxID=1758121 RepID=A0A2I0TIH8_LIMLA|nr:relaxin receptor 2 [Limosa lapponica baueri]
MKNFVSLMITSPNCFSQAHGRWLLASELAPIPFGPVSTECALKQWMEPEPKYLSTLTSSHGKEFEEGHSMCGKPTVTILRMYQKILLVSDPVDLLSSTDQPTGCLNLIDTVLLGLLEPPGFSMCLVVAEQESRGRGAIAACWFLSVVSLLIVVEVK